jgi:hypothetical protein
MSQYQDSGVDKLGSIDSKIPTVGQKPEAQSLPTVLPATQVAALTPPSNAGYALDTSINSLLKPASTLAAVTTVGSVTAITNALPAGTNSIGQVTANAGTNLNTSALALESGGNLASINTKLPAQGQALAAASLPVVLPASQVTALTPPSNTGYSTSALQTTGNTSLGSIDSKVPALGQALITTSMPVVLPASQVTALASPVVQLATVQPTAIIDVASSVIIGTATSLASSPTWGVSQVFTLSVTAVSGTLPTLDITIQESVDGGTWNNIYVFPTASSVTTLMSPLLTIAGRYYRYVQTVGGTTPSFTRSILRNQSNVQINTTPITTKLGGATIAVSDFSVGARMIKKINVRNSSAQPLFLQFYNSSNLLTAGAVPVTGEIYSIAATGGNLLLDSVTFGVNGSGYGANTRVALSLTQQTYTPLNVFTGISFNLEVV